MFDKLFNFVNVFYIVVLVDFILVSSFLLFFLQYLVDFVVFFIGFFSDELIISKIWLSKIYK